jgi:hypothetical protein
VSFPFSAEPQSSTINLLQSNIVSQPPPVASSNEASTETRALVLAGQFIITKIVPDGPAFQSKEILPGDVLAQVNGTLLEGMSIEQVWSFIVGPPNTRVDLQLFRNRPDYEGAIEPDEIYVSVFRSASTPRQLSPPIISRMSSSPKNWDTSPLRPVHRRTTDAQNTSEFSQYVQKDQVSVSIFSSCN